VAPSESQRRIKEAIERRYTNPAKGVRSA
jgi:hypothetical protein